MKRFMLMAILAFLIFTLNVDTMFAYNNQITITAPGSFVTLNTSDNKSLSTNTSISDAKFPIFRIKNSNAGSRIICLSGWDVEAPPTNTTCNQMDWSNDKQKYGVAYIINLINSDSSTEQDLKYWWKEVLINGYLGNTSGYVSGHRLYDYYIGTETKILNTNKSFSQIVSDAETYANSDFSNASIDSGTITFTKGNDGYYYSNQVEINFNGNEISLGNISNNKFSYTNNGSLYTFKIKETDIAIGDTESFSITAGTTKSTGMIASRYYCVNGSTTYQDVTLDTFEQGSTSDQVTISGSVTRERKTIEIKKTDEKGTLIKNVTFELKTEDQKNENLPGITKTTDGLNNLIFNELIAGTYYLKEVSAPLEYNNLNDEIKIVITEDGKILVNDVDHSNIITIENTLTKVKITKLEATGKKELPGATLEIQDEDGNIVKYCQDKEGKVNTECKWISEDKPYEIEGLPIGKYYLVETIAPDGYELSQEKVLFEVKGDGKVVEVKMKNELKVKVPNTLSSKSASLIFLAMLAIALGIGVIIYVKRNRVTR